MTNVYVNRNALLGVVAALLVAVACAAYFGLALGAAKVRASEAETADWKERAFDAYQRMLFTRVPAGQSALLPAGTIMDCESEQSQVGDRVILKQKNCKFYPPRAN